MLQFELEIKKIIHLNVVLVYVVIEKALKLILYDKFKRNKFV